MDQQTLALASTNVSSSSDIAIDIIAAIVTVFWLFIISMVIWLDTPELGGAPPTAGPFLVSFLGALSMLCVVLNMVRSTWTSAQARDYLVLADKESRTGSESLIGWVKDLQRKTAEARDSRVGVLVGLLFLQVLSFVFCEIIMGGTLFWFTSTASNSPGPASGMDLTTQP